MDNSSDQPKPIVHSRKRLFNFNKKQLAIVGVVLLVISSIVGIIIFYNSNQAVSKPETVYDIISRANELVNNGDNDGAKRSYDNAISRTSDVVLKSALLTSKANVFYNEQNYDQALSLAIEAENLSSNENITQFIANIYLLKGDKEKAVEYYQKTVSLIDGSAIPDDSRSQYYQSIVNSLTGVSE